MSTLIRLRAVSSIIFYSVFVAMVLALLSDIALLFGARTGFDQQLLSIKTNSAMIILAGFGLVYLRRHDASLLTKIQSIEREKLGLARYDELTGVLARRHFMEELKRTVGTFRDHNAVSLLLLDVDEFKKLNDSLGHPAGDEALVAMTRLIRTTFPDGIIGRLGGDEFAVIVAGNDTSTYEGALQKFYRQLEAPIRTERFAMQLSASIGIATVPTHTTNQNELISFADLALYQSKAMGRGKATVFDPEMLYDERQHRFIERELRAAIRLDQLELHYQPLVDPGSSIRAVEALVRWNHAYRGRIQPSEFISVAERSMLIDHLGEWVFQQACRDIASFPGCRISINVSAAQLQRDNFVAMVEKVLAERGVAADRFVLEITETAMASAAPSVVVRLEKLRAMGFSIVLDDFGTGFCSFNYLSRLPIDGIKIDRSYIQRLETDEVAQVFVASVSQIGRVMNIEVVAEGVETETERTLAVASGCSRIQGYLICPPLPLREFRARYAGNLPQAA